MKQMVVLLGWRLLEVKYFLYWNRKYVLGNSGKECWKDKVEETWMDVMPEII